MKRSRIREGWCTWADKPCPSSCPIPSVDNSGSPYPGCAIMRLKTQAEIEAELRALRSKP